MYNVHVHVHVQYVHTQCDDPVIMYIKFISLEKKIHKLVAIHEIFFCKKFHNHRSHLQT